MSNPFNTPGARPAGGVDRIAPQAAPAAPAGAPGLRSLDDAVSKTGAPSLFTKRSQVGDSGGGPILGAEIQHRRDFTTGELLYWNDGNAQEQVVVRVQTDERDPAKPEDDGVRGIYIKTWGTQLAALRDAISAAGYTVPTEALAPGNYFYAQLTGEQPSTVRGGDPEKLYAYVIQRGDQTPDRAEMARQAGVLTSDPADTSARPPF